MKTSLGLLLTSQEKFQQRMGHDFSNMSRLSRSNYMKEHSYFLIEEVTEMLREMPFHKSWKDYSSWTEEDHQTAEKLMKEEAIDALHFMINILLALGMDEAEVVEMYKEKNKLNYERQEDPELGYTNGGYHS